MSDELRELLAGLDRVAYDQQRHALKEKYGVRIGTMDAIRREAIGTAQPATPQRSSNVWPEPVDGEKLLIALCHMFERFLIVSSEAILALALWVIHSHAHAAASQSPILLIWGPMADCGKSRALDIVSRLVPNVLRGTSLTLAYVLRRAAGRTVCWDEIDKEFRKKGQNIDGWFTCGWQRGRVFGRCEGENNTPTDYDPWLPKCIAMIGLPHDEQVLSRCLPIEMRRKLEGQEIEEYFDTEEYPELSDLQSQVARWAADRLDRLRKARPEKPNGLRGTRPFDNWRPLLAIADEIGGTWPERARAAALALQPRNDQDRAVELLSDLRELFVIRPAIQLDGKSTFWPSAEIVKYLIELEDREYETVNRGRAITQKWLANQLAPFGVESTQPWIGTDGRKTKGSRGYHVASFADAFQRYLSPPSGTSDPSEPSEPRPTAPGSDGSDGSDSPGGTMGMSVDREFEHYVRVLEADGMDRAEAERHAAEFMGLTPEGRA